MKLAMGLAIFVFAASASITSAEAKGCLKGAMVGGVAGHFAGHHGVIGAAAGCAYGRHEANKRDRTKNPNQSGRDTTTGQEHM